MHHFFFFLAAEFPTPTGIPTKKVKPKIETHPVTIQAKISKCSV